MMSVFIEEALASIDGNIISLRKVKVKYYFTHFVYVSFVVMFVSFYVLKCSYKSNAFFGATGESPDLISTPFFAVREIFYG